MPFGKTLSMGGTVGGITQKTLMSLGGQEENVSGKENSPHNFINERSLKTDLEKYCSIKTSHTGVNNMWILKNSTNLLSSLGHLGVHRATSIQTFDFSTLYTSIPHDLLKSRMNNIINNAFKHKNGATRYTHIKVGRNKSYFTSDSFNGDNKYTANDICKND